MNVPQEDQIETVYNRLAEPDGHESLLFLKRGTLEVEVRRLGEEFEVLAIRVLPTGGAFLQTALHVKTLELAVEKADWFAQAANP